MKKNQTQKAVKVLKAEDHLSFGYFFFLSVISKNEITVQGSTMIFVIALWMTGNTARWCLSKLKKLILQQAGYEIRCQTISFVERLEKEFNFRMLWMIPVFWVCASHNEWRKQHGGHEGWKGKGSLDSCLSDLLSYKWQLHTPNRKIIWHFCRWSRRAVINHTMIHYHGEGTCPWSLTRHY